VDTIRAGGAPAVIRRKGAEGALPVSLAERIEILILLCGDSDESLRLKAWETLVNSNPAELEQLLADAATPWPVIDYLAVYLAPGRPNLVEAFSKNPGIPPELVEWVKQTSAEALPTPPPPPSAAPVPEAEEAEGESQDGKKRQTLIQRIGAMTPVEKIKTALTGSQEERMALIKDGNKLVSRAVLSSPKLSDAEIENYASMKNVTEEVLRTIATNRRFMKSYSVARSLINNPRAPLDVTLPFINRMNARDLKTLSMNKNVPETLRAMAAKLIKQKQDAQKAKIQVGKH
jgi:hypothetical protein